MASPQSETTRDIVWLLRANADDCDENDGPYSGAANQAALDREAANEIERLRIRLLKIAHAPAPQSNALAQTLKAWAMPREGEYPYA